jgi:hypothetical protein
VGSCVLKDQRVCPQSDLDLAQRTHLGAASCAKAGIGCTARDNGFRRYDDPAALQRICDRLGPGAVKSFFWVLLGFLWVS